MAVLAVCTIYRFQLRVAKLRKGVVRYGGVLDRIVNLAQEF